MTSDAGNAASCCPLQPLLKKQEKETVLKKTLRGALVAGVALAASFGSIGAASATTDVAAANVPVATVGDVEGTIPDINIGNDLCLLPWFWPGPFNVLTEGQTGSYAACNGPASETGEGINILNNVCALPWLWQGPFNVLTSGLDSSYEACNSVEEADVFSNAIMQYMTIEYMIDQEMLDEGAFESLLQGEVSTHDVILDQDALDEIGAQQAEAAGDINLGNNACLLPWLWQGPLNFLTEGQTAVYEACNS